MGERGALLEQARHAIVEGFQTEADLARIYREAVGDAALLAAAGCAARYPMEATRRACQAALWPFASDAAALAMGLAIIAANQRELVRDMARRHVARWFRNLTTTSRCD